MKARFCTLAVLSLMAMSACSEPTGPRDGLVVPAPQFSHTDTGPFDGLIGQWKLDGDAQDSGPNGLHGTLVGTFPSESDPHGVAGAALSFAAPRHMTVPNDPLLNFSGDFTLMFWMNSSTVAGYPVDVIAGQGKDVANAYEFYRPFGSDVVIFFVRPIPFGPVQSVSASVPLGGWHHVAAVVDNGVEMRMYVDGVLTSSYAMTSGFTTTNTHPLVLGRHYSLSNGGGAAEYSYQGSLDDFRAYGRVVGPCEIGIIAGDPCDPPTKDDCKHGGWTVYGFKNQGQCVRFVQTGKDSRA